MNDLAKFFIVFAILVVITACSFATRDSASTIEVRLYGDGQLNRGYMA
jgi:predicted component of type VI protein secretion system